MDVVLDRGIGARQHLVEPRVLVAVAVRQGVRPELELLFEVLHIDAFQEFQLNLVGWLDFASIQVEGGFRVAGWHFGLQGLQRVQSSTGVEFRL